VANTRSLRMLVAVCAAGAAVALPGAANAGLISGLTGALLPTCGATSQVFQQFGDSSHYYPVPNQGFENGSAGWTLTGGAKVVTGSEPWGVSGAGTSSLSLPPGSSATSPATCINLLAPHIRLFSTAGAADGNLNVQVVFKGLTGNLLGILNYGTFSADSYRAWRPSDQVASLLALPLATMAVQLKFTPVTSSGSWQIDDVYIDPLRVL
jgi:hypothetical protein